MTRTVTASAPEPRRQRSLSAQEKFLADCAPAIEESAKKWLRQFHGAIEVDDLMQIARTVVLTRVMKYYNPKRATLKTFAYTLVEQEIRRCIRTTQLHGLLQPDQRAAWGEANRRRDEGDADAEQSFGNRPRAASVDLDVDDDPDTSHEALVNRLHATSVIAHLEDLPPHLRRIALALAAHNGAIRPAARALGKPHTHHTVRAGRDAIRAWARARGIEP